MSYTIISFPEGINPPGSGGGGGVSDHGALLGLADDDHSQYLLLSPGSSTRNVLLPTGAAFIPMVIKGASSQSANLLNFTDNADAIVAAITKDGGFIFNEQGADIDSRIEGDTDANLFYIDAGADRVGVGTASPASKLDVRTTAASGIGLMVRAAGTTPGNISEFQNSSGGILAAVNKDGGFIFNETGADTDSRMEGDTEPNLFYLDASTDRIGIGTSGPSARLTIYQTDSTTPGLLTQDAGTGDAAMSFNISGLTYAFGIDNSDSDLFKLSKNSSLGTNDFISINTVGDMGLGATPNAKLDVRTITASGVGLMVRAAATTPGNIAEFQNSSGTAQAAISSAGAGMFGSNLHVGSLTTDYANYQAFILDGNSGRRALGVRAASGQSVNIVEVQANGGSSLTVIGSTGTVSHDTTNGSQDSFTVYGANFATLIGKMGRANINTADSIAFSGGTGRTIAMLAEAAGTVALVVQGFTSQSANLQQWQNNSGTVLSAIESDGTLAFNGNGVVRSSTAAGIISVRGGSTGQVKLGDVTSTASSGTFNPVLINTTINQSGTAIYYGMLIQPTMTAVGSGEKAALFINPTSTQAPAVKGLVIKAAASHTANLFELQDSNAAVQMAITANGRDFALDTTTGSKIGTAITQKIGWWNATPVIQSTGWSVSNVSSDKSFDADATSLDELADVVGTIMQTLLTYGLLGA